MRALEPWPDERRERREVPSEGDRVRLRRTRGTVIATDYHSSGETFTSGGYWSVRVELDNGQRWVGRWTELRRL